MEIALTGIEQGPPTFLFLGNVDKESAVEKLKNSGVYYRKKMLQSGYENWLRINEILQDPTLVGVLVKLTAQTCDMLVHPAYETPAKLILESLQRLPHAILVHEQVLAEEEERPVRFELPQTEDDDDLSFLWDREFLRSVDPEVREKFRDLAQRYNLHILPYKTNAELSALASTFIGQHDRKLLFRIYIPSGRLWAAEAGKLLDLFRSWLGQVKGQRIRLGGYTTSSGEVHEFYGDEALKGEGLSDELKSFSDFLDLCIHDPEAAERILAGNNIEKVAAAGIIARYARDARRLNRDIRQEREVRVLAIRHRLEAELEEESTFETDSSDIIERMIPSAARPMAALAIETTALADRSASPKVVINQQYINSVHGIVAQEVSGNASLNPDAIKLLELVSRFGEADSAVLESAVHEVEDPDAEQEDRLTAAQRLKGFLFRIGDKASDVALATLQKYIESKIGS
ncbi:hypothetical protein AB0F17_65775 [Nonomuraea sp. NPDC026600]|uniref:hypothetical protein n=1 Tax=Nonomuraea sp. NPDC026600 TaxID=3155363 RepID=UPI00340C01F7